MGNFQIGYTFSTYAPTAANGDADYPSTNLFLYSHTKRHFRTLSDTASLIILDQGATNMLSGIFLNDVNFATCVIMGNASTNFGAPSFSTQITISQDGRVGRYKAYHPLPIDYRYIGITLPNGMAKTDALTVYRIGTIGLVKSMTTVTLMPTDYEWTADEECITNEMQGGWYEDVRMGDNVWEGTLSYSVGLTTVSEAEFKTLTTLRKNANLIFYENNGDESQAYICRRRSRVEIKQEAGGLFTPSNITFRELL